MFKIVQILPALGLGGAQVFCIELCNELAKNHDYDVTLVSLYDHNKNHLSLHLINKEVRFISLGKKKKGIDFRMMHKVYRLLKKIQPDVVHAHLHAGYYTLWAYLRIRKPFRKIFTFHSLVKKDAPLHGRLMYKYFFKKGIIQPVSISEEVLKGAVEEYGEEAKTLIHNGSLPARITPNFAAVAEKINSFKKNRHTKVLISVGRICKTKNHRLILDCMKQLEKEGANVIALIIGDHAPKEKNLYKELLACKPGNVHFIGKTDDVGNYLLNADAFLMPSLYEGLPISLLEALSAGVIPICTPVGGLRDIIKTEIGFLSKDLSVENYLAAIKAYLSIDCTTLEKLRANARVLYTHQFSIESCATKYDMLYHTKTIEDVIMSLALFLLSSGCVALFNT